MPMRKRSHRSRSGSHSEPGKSWFGRSKGRPGHSGHPGHSKRKSAVRLDLSDSRTGASLVLAQKSNRWALAFCLFVVAVMAVVLFREYDLAQINGTWNQPTGKSTTYDYELPLQPPVTAPPVEVAPPPPPKERSRMAVAMDFRPKAKPEALRQAALALDAAKFGKHAEARLLVDEALGIDPEFSGWHFISGRVACYAGDGAKMKSELDASIQKGEAMLPSLSILGEASFFLGEFAAAEAYFRAAHEMIPEEPWFLIRISQALRGAGNREGSLALARQALAIPGAEWAQPWVVLGEMESGGKAPANLAEILAGNTTGNLSAWWLVAAVDAYMQGKPAEAAKAMESFKNYANEETLPVVGLDPWCKKWSGDPVMAPSLPELPVFSWKRIRVQDPAGSPSP